MMNGKRQADQKAGYLGLISENKSKLRNLNNPMEKNSRQAVRIAHSRWAYSTI